MLHTEYGFDLDQMDEELHVAGRGSARARADVVIWRTAQGELRDYLNRMIVTKTREARALLKERFDYPIFLYEVEKVGITATGEPDTNELYPNERMPNGVAADNTCLEQYRHFRKNPKAFALEGAQS